VTPVAPAEGALAPAGDRARICLSSPAMGNLCAYDAAGAVLVLCDGRQILVHGGRDESPLWKVDLLSDPVGLAAVGGTVVTLEASGTLSFWSADQGAPLGTLLVGGLVGGLVGDPVEGAPTALAAARDRALFAAVLPGGVAVVERDGEPRVIPCEGATAAAFTADGARLAVGSASGEIRILTAGGDPVGSARLDGPVASLCWFPAGTGMWLATSGDRVLRLGPEGGTPEHVTRARDMTPDCLSASADGSMFAVRLTAGLMMAFAYPSRETVVQLDYTARTITGVAFGPGRRLGVALAGGDGNFVDIPGGQLLRTDTFPGRTHNRWLVGVVIEPSRLAPAPAQPAGQPVARAAAKAAAARPAAPVAAAAPQKSTLGVWIGIGVALAAAALALNRCM